MRAWYLALSPARFGEGEPGETMPIVRAFTKDRRVTHFALHIGAAGE